MSNSITIFPSNYDNPSAYGKGIDCLIRAKDSGDSYTVYLGDNVQDIVNKLAFHKVSEVYHSSCMEFATEYGWKTNKGALKLWNKAWKAYVDKYAKK